MILSLLLLGPTLSLVQADPAQTEPAHTDPPHVVFVVGEGEYQSQATMPALAERLEDAFGWRTTVLLDEELHAGEDNHVPGLEALEGADLCVLYLRFRQWPIEDLAALDRYVGRGGAIAAFRTSTHAFLYDDGDPSDRYNDFGAEVLGAPWIHHYGHESSTDVALAGGAAESPILDGVPAEFHVRSWTYHVQPDFPPADARVLAYGTPVPPDGEEPDEDAVNPVAWTLVNGRGGRVFTTTMGHPEDFHVEAFRRLVGNGMHWALGLDAPEATAADLPRVLHPDDLGGGDAPWERMDYGPFLSTAVSIGEDVPAVPKGIVVEVRTEDGEPTGLRAVYDTDLVAWRCVWDGELELSGIVFDGPHGTFPSVNGEPLLRSSAVAGVGEAVDPRPAPYGPIAPGIAQHEGLVLDGDDVWFEASARDGAVRWRERVFAVDSDEGWVFVRDVDVVSDDAAAAPLVFGGFDLDGGAAAAVVHGRGETRGGRALVASSGRVRIAYYRKGASRTLDLADPSDAAPKHRGRWGKPIKTAGVLDDAED
ncbi:MAG: ThuA domain-containing protein, partial [Planctomycetota bacterium]